MPTIYYVGYLPPKTGGEMVNLQHVAALHSAGRRAVALVNAGYSPSNVPADLVLPMEVLKPGKVFAPDDVVVVPEYYRDAILHFTKQPCRAVLHVQGPFLLFRGLQSVAELNALPWLGVLTCSHFCAETLAAMGVRVPAAVVRPPLLPVFCQSALGDAKKKLQIAYMPEKRPKEAPVVRAIFQARYPAWASVPWVPIANVSRAECARLLAESAVFASFSYLEGLGLPPLEAMASGCAVAGFDGLGGREYATAENGLWVPEADHAGFADALAQVLAGCSAAAASSGDSTAHRARLAAGRRTAASFSQARFSAELLAAWRGLLGERFDDFVN
jgi:glycosyltransferase involved in cell wall biosynthesis